MRALEAFYICAVFKLDIISADWNIAAHDLAKRIQCLLEVWVVTTVLNLHLLLCSLTVGATVSWQLPLFIEWSGSMNLYFDQLQDIEIHTEVSLPNRTTLTVNAEGRNKKKKSFITLTALQYTYPLLHEYVPWPLSYSDILPPKAIFS